MTLFICSGKGSQLTVQRAKYFPVRIQTLDFSQLYFKLLHILNKKAFLCLISTMVLNLPMEQKYFVSNILGKKVL